MSERDFERLQRDPETEPPSEYELRTSTASYALGGPPEGMPNSDAYLVVYEDGTERTVWGYTIRYAADVSADDPDHGDPVRIERLKRS